MGSEERFNFGRGIQIVTTRGYAQGRRRQPQAPAGGTRDRGTRDQGTGNRDQGALKKDSCVPSVRNRRPERENPNPLKEARKPDRGIDILKSVKL